jgi:hypothetical protein
MLGNLAGHSVYCARPQSRQWQLNNKLVERIRLAERSQRRQW